MAAKSIEFTISAVDKATATVNRINRNIAKMTRPYQNLAKSAKRFSEASGLTNVAKSLGKVGKEADKVVRSVTKIGAPLLAIVGGGTLAGLSEMVTQWERIGSETERTSRMLGITANQLVQMRGAASLMGLSQDTMTAGFQALQDTLQDARWGRNQGAYSTLRALGIQLHTTKEGAIDTHAAMYDLADIMQRIQKRDPAAARNLARSLGVEQLLPMLIQGRQGMQQFEAEARRLRGDFTPDMAKRAQDFTHSVSGMGLALDGLKASIADRLAPVLGPMIDRLTNWIAANRELISQRIAAIVERIANALERLLEGTDWDTFIKNIGDAVDTIGSFITWTLQAIKRLGGFKAVATGLALYMGGSFVASVVSSIVTIGGALVKLGMLAWANPIVLAIAAIAAGIAGVVWLVNKLTHNLDDLSGSAGSVAASGSRWGVLGDWLDQRFGWHLNEAQNTAPNTAPGTMPAPGPGAEKETATVAQWAQKLNFGGLEKQYGLPAGTLGAVAGVESGGNAANVNPKSGAAGLFQFMPATAKEYGVNPLDPGQEAGAAAKKLGGLYKRYHGDLTATLAAYNWGEGNLERKGLANAPAETQAYVPKVLAHMGTGAQAPALPPLNAPPPQNVVVPAPNVTVNNQVNVARDGRTSIRTQTPTGLKISAPLQPQWI